jgi:hypothetical protein
VSYFTLNNDTIVGLLTGRVELAQDLEETLKRLVLLFDRRAKQGRAVCIVAQHQAIH